MVSSQAPVRGSASWGSQVGGIHEEHQEGGFQVVTYLPIPFYFPLRGF